MKKAGKDIAIASASRSGTAEKPMANLLMSDSCAVASGSTVYGRWPCRYAGALPTTLRPGRPNCYIWLGLAGRLPVTTASSGGRSVATLAGYVGTQQGTQRRSVDCQEECNQPRAECPPHYANHARSVANFLGPCPEVIPPATKLAANRRCRQPPLPGVALPRPGLPTPKATCSP